ncbi:S8 family serine peptidase [Kineococcus glutinatus]|uniref:Peptidase inhibitor I9 n=1 Tax=Kineococcus glutinatus TaxID=1070872 RepID=A0ABP9I109_9ACTN
MTDQPHPAEELPGPHRAHRRRGVVALAWAAGAVLVAAGAPGAAAAPQPAQPVEQLAGEQAGQLAQQRAEQLAEQLAEEQVPPAGYTAGRYVVALAADPLASARRSAPGLPTLKSAPGRVDLRSAEAGRYREVLERAQDRVAAAVGATPRQRYTVAFNGFTADLSAAQAERLAVAPGVLSVVEDTAYSLDTTDTPGYLGLTGEGGVWAGLGGAERAGEGVVVGVIDSGAWPESPSLAGEPLAAAPTPGQPFRAHRGADGRIVQPKADGDTFTGTCQTGQGWTPEDCSTKIVGARYFDAGFLASVDPAQIPPTEQLSARDGNGHGTHTASTAVGNAGVEATVNGSSYGEAAGMAPGASLAVYKVCWEDDDPATGNCFVSDAVAAVDAAVADGVDVINFSISSTGTIASPIQLAFLSAASAGVFVAASAGNEGPGASTSNHPSPWVTTVAAATAVPREGTVVLGDGRRFAGASINRTPLPRTPLVAAGSAPAAGVPAADAALCLAGSLDPAAVAGGVVLCERGTNDRVDKSAEVARAGGVGTVLVNPAPNSVDPDPHRIPTVHLDTPAGDAVAAYAATAGATVAFEVGNTTGRATPTPQIAGFSSRGPNLDTGADVLKPDVAAPGVGIIAAVAPPTNGGNAFAPYSGTSMAAPHVAGLAALYLGLHPDWSPMAVKSALVTSARDVVDAAGAPTRDVFAAGAGFVDPARALDPGLVYDSGPADWLAFLEGSGYALGTGVAPIDPSDLNQPSVAIGWMVGRQTVTRSVTAVEPGVYHATAEIPGVDVEVSPSILHFSAAGQTKTFKVTFTADGAPMRRYATGFLTWRGAGGTVRSPMAVRPIPLASPASLSGTGASGSTRVSVLGGTTGELDLDVEGFATGVTRRGQLWEGATAEYPVEIGEDVSFARVQVEAANQAADLDLAVFRVDGPVEELVAVSQTPAADELVDIVDPPAGRYLVLVKNFANAPGESGAAFEGTAFLVDPGATAGSLSAHPDRLPLAPGRRVAYTLSWDGLDPARKYLGIVRYGLSGYGGSLRPTALAIG